jgi:hypothetical protein
MSTALVPFAPKIEKRIETAPAGHAGARPNAEFLTQLIATVGQAPQTRLRRRAESEEAIAAYGTRGRLSTPAGRAMSRSL